MEELNQLAILVRQKGKRSIQLANQNFRKKEKSKDNQLYDLIVNEKINCEKRAAEILFNTDPTNRNFRNTKLKLRQKLLNHLFFLDYDRSENTLFEKVKYDCLLKLSQYKILLMEDQPSFVLKRINQLIHTALEYELIEIALECLLMLRSEYSGLGKYNPQLEAEKQIHHLSPFHKAIIESEALYYDTLVLINKSRNSCHKIKETIPYRIKMIRRHAGEFNSPRLEILSELLLLEYYRICHKYDLILKICDRLEDKFIPADTDKIRVNINAAFLTELKLDAYYKLNQICQFNDYCFQKQNLFRTGSQKWFSFMEYWILLNMKSGDYGKATEIFKKVKNNAGFGKLDKDLYDRWIIYRAYLCFISNCREIHWGFNINKQPELKPESVRNHHAYNTAVLVIRFLFNLRDGNASEVKDIVGQLQHYSSTHLDKRRNYRNSIFIRMLEIVVSNNFNHECIRDKVSVYHQKLSDNYILNDISEDLEVIPYEKLWDVILNILATNKHFLHFRFYHYNEV